ncbi:MAG: OmpA family protein [Saprospiraceae bacterium]|nr:OmpA family protein [Saprospiraceae bacterium]
MKKPLLFAALLLMGRIFIVAQTPDPAPALLLYFDTDRSALTEAHQQEITQFLANLPGKPTDYSITIAGHTDARGSDAYNQNLSMRRGQGVAEFLAGRGFPPAAVQVNAKGEVAPLAANDSDEGMLRNRRVELHVERGAWSQRPSDLVPLMKVHFQAGRGITFASPLSGSRVQIPGGVLVYPDGSPVQGEVELQYREWRNLYDYLSFGLPMHYSDGRGSFFFNSNGMFEVQAYQKGQALGIAKGQSIQVSFVQTRDMPDVNLYRFEPKSGQWVTAPSAGPASAAMPAVLSDFLVETTNNGFGQNLCTPSALRFSAKDRPADILAEAVQTGYELATGARRNASAFFQDPYQEDTALVRLSERTQVQVHRYEDVKSYFYIEDLQGSFEELGLLRDFKWEYVPSLLQSNLTDEDMNRAWDAVYLAYDVDNNLYDVQFVSPKLKLEIKARMLRMDGRQVTREENPPLFREYKSIQKKRWESKLAEVAALRRFLSLSLALRENDELCLGHVEWLKYFVNNRKKMAERYGRHVAADYRANPDAGNALIQAFNQRCRATKMANLSTRMPQSDLGRLTATLQVVDFGVYNCDQIFRLGAETQVLAASFRSTDGQPIQSRQTSIIEKSSQMMLSAPSPNQVYYTPSKAFDIVVTGTNGRTYLLRESEFAALPLAGRSAADFVLEDVTDQVKTPKDWMRVLGI